MGLFNNKTKTVDDNTKSNDKTEVNVLPRPKICCVDVDKTALDTLTNNGYSIYKGSLGGIMNVPNKRRDEYHHLLLDYDFPVNFHEYDILILDLTNEIKKDFEPVAVTDRQTRSQKILSLICSFPTTVFDPRPLTSSILGKRVREVKNRKFIQIVFASEQYEVDYEIVEITNEYPQRHPNEKHQLYDFNYRGHHLDSYL